MTFAKRFPNTGVHIVNPRSLVALFERTKLIRNFLCTYT